MSTILPTGGPAGLSAKEEDVLATMVAWTRLFTNQMARETRAKAGIALADFEVVTRLALTPENRMRMSELAEQTQSSRSRLSHQIDRMEAAGLVQREDCDEDRRGSFTVLTKAGCDLWEKTAPDTIAGIRKHFADRVTARDLDTIDRIFSKLTAYLVDVTEKPLVTAGDPAPKRRRQTSKSA